MAREYFKNLPDKTTPLTASRINGLLNGKESMGSIVVEDIQCKNLYNPDNARASGGSLQNCDNTIYLQPNTNYVFKSNHTWTQVRLYNSSGVETRSIGGDREDITEISFTTTSDEVKGLFIFYVGDYFNINELDFTGIQLEKGTVATEYTPHKEFSNKQIYSTEEQVIGKWIDKKPLYRKVLFLENKNLVSSTVLSLGTIPNIENVIKCDCNVQFKANSTWAPIPFAGLNANNYTINDIQLQYVTISSATGVIAIQPQFGSSASQTQSLSKIILVIEYTKTTD